MFYKKIPRKDVDFSKAFVDLFNSTLLIFVHNRLCCREAYSVKSDKICLKDLKMKSPQGFCEHCDKNSA